MLVFYLTLYYDAWKHKIQIQIELIGVYNFIYHVDEIF